MYCCRYGAEVPIVFIQSVMYLAIMAVTRLARPNFSKLCYRRPEKSVSGFHTLLKVTAVWLILAGYVAPFFLVPRTVHPVLGWCLYLLGSSALLSVVINAFLLPVLPVLVPWLGITGSLAVMAFPWYSDGVVRALAIFAYAFCCSPIAWNSLVKVMSCVQTSLEREAFFPRLGESPQPEFTKLYWNPVHIVFCTLYAQHQETCVSLLVHAALHCTQKRVTRIPPFLATQDVSPRWRAKVIRDVKIKNQCYGGCAIDLCSGDMTIGMKLGRNVCLFVVHLAVRRIGFNLV